MDKWHRAQELELSFHQSNQWRQSDAFMKHAGDMFTLFGFEPHSFHDMNVVDVGAGSRLRTKWFEGARIYAIEPLAPFFMRDIPWCDLREAMCFASPAERYLDELEGIADLVVCINVLDHCYDTGAVLDNIYSYMKPEGVAVLSYDDRKQADDMHPQVMDEIDFEQHGLFAQRLMDTPAYSGEGIARNYILYRITDEI